MSRLALARPGPLAVATLLAVALPAGAQPRFHQRNLVSDIPGLAKTLDPQLVNPWGIASSAGGPFWVSDAATGVSTLYNGAAVKQGLVVTIPVPGGGQGIPTGQVFNTTGSLPLGNGANGTFFFATIQGTIAGWNGAAGTSAITMVNTAGAVYTGLAISGSGATARLYASNFAAGTIDAFDNAFGATLPGRFSDPTLPAGYSPFNIQNVGGTLYVAYAVVDPATGEEQAGAGLGIVDVYDLDGNFVRRVSGPGGDLDAPWGFAIAPSSFGAFAGALLVGNFGDGTIHAYDPTTGTHLGVLLNQAGLPIVNEGLWGLRVGNGGNGGDPERLYFAAGIDDEAHGLFGSIAAVPEPTTLALEAAGLGALLALVPRRRRRR